MNSALDLFATYAGRREGLQRLVEGRPDQSRSEPAAAVPGRPGLNLYRADVIYADMLNHAQPPPDGLFVGSTATVDELERRILVSMGRAAE